MGDETIANFNVPAFTFAGQSYSRIGVVSNGYVVVGGGTSADVQFLNQDFPDADRPNNVLAPFWTDLDLAKGGAVRVGTLTDGVDHLARHRLGGRPGLHRRRHPPNSFEVWIRLGTEEDVTYTYGPVGAGDGGFLTVGAENLYGNRGQSVLLQRHGHRPGRGHRAQGHQHAQRTG